ncbi:MBL fold metallo-hydrolase [Tuwongella immobilis]|uniref:Metallo-beta-lactamase domain-containing protein n=1 Tax=Tuwongella immobilis TaxID=692036 RepID=A0A6C2YQK9_9BACT|nr:MBL fold metallo-hydrolase [Tuwongella immobilis]VIP03928.1 Metal-dependent hydrolase, beta-lactamase superfamily I OS=Singulisphaera acidiphila (strain ATCC BAA-1392 / DSM 18658 / VKM B-2454 / MOB10) GN=Sinac_2698 PE=4 SV=1: Lactamase_B_2 [Tuwongella immobilis]VTS05223.1 Metal-dependent hydrolase, beta-lactamase superfamily I OS=Singulisphaera acidiphila (strain ATCC BAA-1392 / DSM 18658 / VKM B-2454 / MOB10) GN=Sinac_2698 PE=4 SV=1: Lactamase_B_2 [Tuwongella immobilis]
MSIQFSQLASGSRGNVGFLQSGGQSVLIDVGLSPRTLQSRLATIGADVRSIRAAVLTHTHGDHWKPRSLDWLLQHRIPLFCHADHFLSMGYAWTELERMKALGLVHFFLPNEPFRVTDRISATPFWVSHDARPTFGFRFEEQALFGPLWSMAYASDLGTWDQSQLQAMANVDLLAVEFNHDEAMERRSSRPRYLIDRVLGNEGHLSNRQASELVQEVVAHSRDVLLKHLILLHLSGECNTAPLARSAAEVALFRGRSSAQILVAQQDRALPCVSLLRAKRPVQRGDSVSASGIVPVE